MVTRLVLAMPLFLIQSVLVNTPRRNIDVTPVACARMVLTLPIPLFSGGHVLLSPCSSDGANSYVDTILSE